MANSKAFCSKGHEKTIGNRYGSQCIPCIKIYQQTPEYKAYRQQYVKSQQFRRAKNAASKIFRASKRGTDYHREYRWRNLGLKLTLEEYKVRLVQQGNKCAICQRKREEFKKNFSVDHDHETGIIRGLLCGTCNRGIGFFRENTNILSNAIAYLKQGEL